MNNDWSVDSVECLSTVMNLITINCCWEGRTDIIVLGHEGKLQKIFFQHAVLMKSIINKYDLFTFHCCGSS